MIKITDKNRGKILEDYISNMVDSMDWAELRELAYSYLYDNKINMTNVELKEEILDWSPHILEK